MNVAHLPTRNFFTAGAAMSVSCFSLMTSSHFGLISDKIGVELSAAGVDMPSFRFPNMRVVT